MHAPVANAGSQPAAGPRAAQLIELRGVRLAYGRHVVLDDVNLAIPRADFLGIVGANGSGKTSLLRGILGLLRPATGTVARAGVRCGYVPQRQSIDEIYPLSVREIVLMGRYGRLGLVRRPGKADAEIVHRCLKAVRIPELAGRLYRTLSAGQKQRTLLARALAGEPDLLVLDEPTSDMDPAGARAVMELLRGLHAGEGRHDRLTIILVTHDVQEVINYAHRFAFVHDGTVEALAAGAVTGAALSRLYGMPVDIVESEGRKVVVR